MNKIAKQQIDAFTPPADWMFTGEPIRVPVLWILRNAIASCDFGDMSEFGDPQWNPTDDADFNFWNCIVTNKAQDSGFGHLIDSILEHGWNPASYIGFDGESINEGHHRLVAAILLCMDWVWITPYGQSAHVTEKAECAHYSYDEHPIEITLID